MSCEVDFSKRALPDQFIKRVVSNMSEVGRQKFSVNRSVSNQGLVRGWRIILEEFGIRAGKL
jgi:hypothetical protein